MKYQYRPTNLNQYIRFMPTARTASIYKQYLKDLFGDDIPVFVNVELRLEPDGSCKLQMWEFLKIYGKHFGMAQFPTPVGMDVLIEVEEEPKKTFWQKVRELFK